MDILKVCLVVAYVIINTVGWLHLLFRVVDDSQASVVYAVAPMLDIFKDVANPIWKWVLIFVYTIVMIPALLAWYASAVIVFCSRLLSLIFRLIFGNEQ